MTPQVFYSDHFPLPLPDGHRFPEHKYRLLREGLLQQKILKEQHLVPAQVADEGLLALAHCERYIAAVQAGTLDPQSQRRIGFPWSYELFVRSAASVGGCVQASLSALENGFSGCLAGGTHHAFRDRGEGYCVFNDVAVATCNLLRQGHVRRVAILDLDVHQGNGTAEIFANNPAVLTLSVHGEKNFPFRKSISNFDWALPAGTGDQDFLVAVKAALQELRNFAPDFIFYQMGVDALSTDRLGKMNVSMEGMRARDELVLQTAFVEKVPISLALGGGYSDPIDPTVAAYANTYQVAKSIWGWVV